MLGGLKLESTTLTRPKPLLLLAYLSVEGPRSRRDVASLFWGTIKDPMQGLRLALVQLNKEASGVVQSRDNKLWTEVQSDVSELQKALAEGDLHTAIELYKGPFLEGFDVSDIGEELEEWLYRTREDLASQIREVHIKLGEDATHQGKYDEAARHGEAAYLLRSTPEPSPETLERMYLLLQADNNPYATSLAQEASMYNLQLTKTVQAARHALAIRNRLSTYEQGLEPVTHQTPDATRAEPVPVIVHAAETMSMSRKVSAVEKVEPETSVLVSPERQIFQKRGDQPKFLWPILSFVVVAALGTVLLLNGYRSFQVASGSSPASAYTVQSHDELDDVDVGLQSGYFCAIGNNLFLSSAFDNQSTAIRFPQTRLPPSTSDAVVTIQDATLIFTASNGLTSIPPEAGFTIKGVADGSAWVKNDNCDIPAAQNYKDRHRTNAAVTYRPTVWSLGQTYEIDVKAIVQEIVDTAAWPGDALAFAIDKLPASMIDIKAYSIEGAKAARNPVNPPQLRLEYTLNSITQQ